MEFGPDSKKTLRRTVSFSRYIRSGIVRVGQLKIAMHCLESRRSLLTNPRTRTRALHAHLESCAACSQLAVSLTELGRAMEDAANVPVPEGLDERILLAWPEPWVGHKLAAAALGALLVFVTGNVTDKPPAPRAVLVKSRV